MHEAFGIFLTAENASLRRNVSPFWACRVSATNLKIHAAICRPFRMPPITYPCEGKPEIPQGCYSRLCDCQPGQWAKHDEGALESLAGAMKDSPEKRLARAKQNAGITRVPSGYVYLGQFIDHDITKDNRYLADATPDVRETRNFRTARLDLESLYGAFPASVPCIYEKDGERLRLGWTLEARSRNGRTIASSPDDLPRLDEGTTTDGTAIVIDPRNDENLIVAQLHVLFLKFHNRVLRLLKENDLAPNHKESLFDQARRFVTWHYQWLVLHDFLPAIVRKAVLDDISRVGSAPVLYTHWYLPADAPVSMPVEFSVAAFRFGHSMVREGYDLNGHVGGVNSHEIIRMTKRGGGIKKQLPANYVIDWSGFFGTLPGRVNRAQLIDPFITEMLYDLPKQTEEAFRFQSSLRMLPPDPSLKMIPPLPETTLKRGSSIRLPSGEEFAGKFGLDVLSPSQLFPGHEDFYERALNRRTPLWYYILQEAAVEKPEPAMATKSPPTQKLGTVGSRIVTETLYQLLRADAESFLYAKPKWIPPRFTVGQTGRDWCLDSMSKLVRFVKVEI